MENKSKFTYTWRIENYSYSNCRNGEGIISPKFKVDSISGSRWCLDLYPAGSDSDCLNYISCYLCRLEEADAEDIEIDFIIQLVGCDNSILVTFQEENYTFTSDDSWGTPLLLKAELLDKAMAAWTEDLLVVRCTLILKNPIGGCEAKTNIGFSWHSNVWSIKCPDKPNWNEKKVFTIPKMFPVEVSFTAPKDTILIDVSKVEDAEASPMPCKFLTCRLSLLDTSETKRYSKTATHKFGAENGEDTWKFPSFFRKSQLMNNSELFLTYDSFSVMCEFSISNGTETREVLKYKVDNERNTEVVTTLMFDLIEMHDNIRFSDVQLKVGDKTFAAHKAVLAARSPVFLAMFEQDMIESQTGFVEIFDVEAETFKHFLKFLYTGIADMLNSKSSLSLLILADKYQVLSLKEECANFLISAISEENVCEIFETADLVGHVSLKYSASNYILEHASTILPSSEFSIMVTNTTLAKEIFSKLALLFPMTKQEYALNI